jgi:hypothetical protein
MMLRRQLMRLTGQTIDYYLLVGDSGVASVGAH